MAFSKTFERELNKLFRKRTDWLRRRLGKMGAGKPPKFGRKQVTSGIEKLQAIASDALAHQLARAAFDSHVASRRNYRIKGRGPYDKKERFETWFARFKNTKGLIYAFWDKYGDCVYVGRTGSHGSRPSSHFDRFWFSRVRRVTIFDVRGKSRVPQLECLAIHHFQPELNVNRASIRKWTKACPLCTTHRYIEDELRSIFRFR
jgi:hypothetical protein